MKEELPVENVDLETEQSDQNPEPQTPLHLDAKKRKTIIIEFVVILFVIVLLGVARVSNLLNVPLAEVAQNKGDNAIDVKDLLSDNQDSIALRSKDTDEDGINDYDEEFVYETSVFLADSDSDGKSDYEEIYAGEDPNCPEGYTCFVGGNSGGASTDDVEDLNDSELVVPPADTLRALILESGVATKAQLDLFTDEQLIEFYTTAIRENPDAFSAMQDIDLSPKSTVDNPYNYSAEQIRATFKQNGYSEADLASISDEDLKQLFQQALNEAQVE